MGLTHPMDWVAVYESHTPHEWATQIALSRVEPWGDERADLRDGRNAAFAIAASRSEPMSGSAFDELLQTLVRYLKCHQPPESTLGAAAMRRAMGDDPCPPT